MKDKYSINFKDRIIAANEKRLINQLWKLIPMREKEEDWKSHLNVVIEEITGLSEIFMNELNFLILLSKLEGLNSSVCEDFMVYRKTIFRCIELIARLFEHE